MFFRKNQTTKRNARQPRELSAEFLATAERDLFDGVLLPDWVLYSLQAIFERDYKITAIEDEREYLRAGLRKIKLNLAINWFM